MGQCHFKTSELKRCVEHAINSNEFSGGYDSDDSPKVQSPGLLFVHDHGVYIMSNGRPRDTVDNNDTTEGGNAHVVYAKYCNPNVDEDFWENARDLVGGDDFVEFLPFGTDPVRFLANCDEFEEYMVDVSSDYLECSFVRPKAAGNAPVMVAGPA